MIPRTFHRVWLDEPIPPTFEGFWETLKALHPGWEFVTWSDSEALGWMSEDLREVFDWQETWAGRSDVLRYAAVERFGGIYLDTDVEPLRGFDDLLDGPPFAAWEDHNLICPTVIGAEAHHPAMVDLVRFLPRWAAGRRTRPPNFQTGPYFLTARWRRRRDVRLLEPVSFYPVHWSRRDDLGGPYPAESYAVHHWAAGWLKESD
jgi:mannosyltransferase OCH1-like enzyme